MGPVSQAADDAQLPLARLFAIAYRQLITDLHAELARRGWTDVRPAYGFALLALREGPLSSSELGVLMGMTKQAASKLVEALLEAGYARRGETPGDGRVRPIELTDRGRELQETAEGIYTELENRWADVIGRGRLAALRADLVSVVSADDGELPPVRPLW
jgi:DNA-binding MarR family transcriptional regulator